ncbi:MAG: hypothetical protein L6R39_004867 [Caloplaca ligustica]|nr:MAG: hypothetical protein L6R39_004867 [Caloplaca ligustica]
MRSPVSPYQHQSKQVFSSQRPYYPITPQPDSNRNRGLGIFGCGLRQPQSTVQQQLPPSPQPSDGWPQDFQSSQPPDIFTAAYDPFSGFTSSPNTGMMSVSSPNAPDLIFCHTPSSTNLPSHRSSISSSYTPSEAYSQHGSDLTYTPRVKVEDASEWHPTAGNEYGWQRSMTTQCLSPYSSGVSPATAAGEDVYRNAEWPKPGAPAYPLGLQNHEGQRLAQIDTASVLPSVNRIKKKRARTTPEEATHECRVCGKLFKRSYNWKSHMETHNPDRKYPHPCTATVGDTPCTKKFQRKTDLDRHHESVHLKARNHICPLCGHRFARRDTLRRHTEDGCPKRFEVDFREGSAMAPLRWPTTDFPARDRSYSVGMPQPSAMGTISSSGPVGVFPAYSRPELVST